jgi:hypothetical protein
MIGRVHYPVSGTDNRDAQDAVDQHVATDQPIQFVAAGAADRRSGIDGSDRLAKERLGDEMRTLCGRTHRLPLVDLANDREDQRAGKRESERCDDGETKNESRLPIGASLASRSAGSAIPQPAPHSSPSDLVSATAVTA